MSAPRLSGQPQLPNSLMRTQRTHQVLAATLAFVCFGCAFGGTSSGVSSTSEKYLMSASARAPSNVPSGHHEVIEPVLPTLYGRDGSPVATQRGGTVEPGRQPSHSLDSSDGSRMYILELYQQAIDEKEALEIEVGALGAALDKSNDAIEQGALRIVELQKLSEGLRTDVSRLEGEGVELAERLTTAQIRRLEAEKLLLEAKIEWSRLQKMMQDRAAASEANMSAGGRR